MQKQKTYKPTRLIDRYVLKKHPYGGFKIVEYSHFSDEKYVRKRVLYKHLNLSDAEDILYRLESKIRNN